MIDLSLPVNLFDDRCQADGEYVMQKVEFKNDTVALIVVKDVSEAESINEWVLINLENGEVLSTNFEFFYAENVEPEEAEGQGESDAVAKTIVPSSFTPLM